MIKLSLLFLLFSLSLSTMQAKDVIESIELSNGKTIIIYSDKTWAYTSKSSDTRLSNTKSNTYNKSSQISTTTTKRSKSNSSYHSNNYSGLCGAQTKKGGSCRRRVSGGGRCYQH
ncbi:MAG: hypothetical protein RL662_1853 [Bacteroidota bacterium]|jgi:hypothetical protein